MKLLNYSITPMKGFVVGTILQKLFLKKKGLPIKVNPIETSQYPTPAKRPFYSVLNKTNIKENFQMEIPYWKTSLDKCKIIISDKNEN